MKRIHSQDSSGGSGQKKKEGVKWDEANLSENERIKKELNSTKINEPKTPYLSPMDTDEELDLVGAGMSPLTLEDHPAGSKLQTRTAAAAANGWSDSDAAAGVSPRGGGSSATGASPRSDREPGSARFSEQYYQEDDSDMGDTGASGNPERREKRRRFQEARRHHYNMRDTLRRAKQLLEHEGEGAAGPSADADVESEGDEEGSGAASRLLGADAAAAAAAKAKAAANTRGTGGRPQPDGDSSSEDDT